MADISKIKLGSTTYSLKDSEARAAIETLETAVASSLVFKGVVSSAADITQLTNYELGWTYKASASFTLSDLGTVENGDMIICISNYNSAFSASDWTVVQNNVDVMGGASDTTDGYRGLVPTPSAGENDYFLAGDGTWQEAGVKWGTFAGLLGSSVYTQVAYLTSPGNCYIDTEVTGIYHFEIKVRKESAFSTTVYHMGSIEDSTSTSVSYNRSHISLKDFSSSGIWNVNIGANGSSYASYTGNDYSSVDDVLPVEGSVNNGTATFYVNYTDSWTVENSPCTSTTFWLFGRNSGSSAVSSSQDFVGRVYYFKAYDKNDNLIANMIPVLDSDGVPCMYCKVRDAFYYNAGTGELEYAEEETTVLDGTNISTSSVSTTNAIYDGTNISS